MEIQTIEIKVPKISFDHEEREKNYDEQIKSNDSIFGLALNDTKKGQLVRIGTNGIFMLDDTTMISGGRYEA